MAASTGRKDSQPQAVEPAFAGRVALVADWCLPRSGGIETHILALARQLRARDVDATIVTSYPGPAEIGGVPIDRLDCLRLPWLDLAASPNLMSILRRHFVAGRFDMVHIHASIVAPVCLAALRAAADLRLPTIVTFHSVMRTLPYFLSVFDRLSGWSRRNVALTAVSSRVARQLRQVFGDAAVGILPNGFDLDFWRGGSMDCPPGGQFRLVSAMRLQPRKRPFALLDIFAEAIRLAPEADMSLTVAGDGDLRRPLQRRINRRGLGDKVSLVGWQTPEDLRALYRRSSAFVMPSLKESFCIAALEARAAGLPVIARQNTGIADFIRHDVSGILAGSDREMAQAIAGLARDEAHLALLSAEDGGVARYDWSYLAAGHMRLYAERRAASG